MVIKVSAGAIDELLQTAFSAAGAKANNNVNDAGE
jgi:hypothetical protein